MSSKAKAPRHVTDILGDTARLAAQAAQLVRLAVRWERTTGAASHIRSVAIYPPSQSRNGQWLIIGKAWDGGYKLVAFHRSSDLLTALVGFLQRAADGKLEWKPDTYAERDVLPPGRS